MSLQAGVIDELELCSNSSMFSFWSDVPSVFLDTTEVSTKKSLKSSGLTVLHFAQEHMLMYSQPDLPEFRFCVFHILL